MSMFHPAIRHAAKLRLALCGPSGSGKTYSALAIASGLGGRVAVIDTEHGSASRYADEFAFDVLELTSFHPDEYLKAMHAAASEGYDVCIVDTLSHAWIGQEGILDLHDKAVKRDKGGNSFTAWREVTPLHNKLVEGMVHARTHLIVTMRSKTEYLMQEHHGKQVPRKIGMAPIQRDGMEYEFDVVGDLDYDHTLVVSKTRLRAFDGAVVARPDASMGQALARELTGVLPLRTVEQALAELKIVTESQGIDAEEVRAALLVDYGVSKLQRLTVAQIDETRLEYEAGTRGEKTRQSEPHNVIAELFDRDTGEPPPVGEEHNTLT